MWDLSKLPLNDVAYRNSGRNSVQVDRLRDWVIANRCGFRQKQAHDYSHIINTSLAADEQGQGIVITYGLSRGKRKRVMTMVRASTSFVLHIQDGVVAWWLGNAGKQTATAMKRQNYPRQHEQNILDQRR